MFAYTCNSAHSAVRWHCSLLAVVAMAGCVASCQNSGSSAQSDSGTSDSSNEQNGVGAQDGEADAGFEKCGKTLPPDLTGVWEQFFVIDRKCSLCVPSSKESLPPPLVWEPCTSTVGDVAYQCRQIKMDWPSLHPAPYGLAGDMRGYVDSDGKVVLQLRKLYEPSINDIGFMELLVEADGPVRQAFWTGYMTPRGDGRTLVSGTLAEGKSARAVAALNGAEPFRWVWFGGDDTLLRPPILFDRLETDGMTGMVYSGSQFYAVKGHQFGVYKWDGTYLGPAEYGPSAFDSVQWVGPTLLFALASRPDYALMRWTEADGSRELVGFGADYSRGAGTPGSDGKDLVWLQGEDGPDGELMFRNRWVMTSRFSTDPAAIHPRRLTRSLDLVIMAGSGSVPPPVGCGYAAFEYAMGTMRLVTETGLQIVRLSDGAWWKLQSPEVWAASWVFPIAITCDELFARYSETGYETIRRVRLDSLGPPNPPME